MTGTMIVTGGGRGIGAAIVRAAVAAGYAVGFSYRDDRAAAEALAVPLGAVAVQADAADPAAPARLFDAVEAALGPVTALVNNAGITGRIGRFQDLDPALMQRVLEVNVMGPMLCAQEAVRRWTARGTAGAVVNISSIAAKLGSANEYVHYAASKAAVEAFTLGLARELAPTGIRVNAVAPGTVPTTIHAAGGEPDRPARVVGRIPMGRLGRPEEMATAVLWLLSDQASYVTGATLPVAGGL